MLSVADVGVGDAEAHAQLFGKPRLGDTSLLQKQFSNVAMLFLLPHQMIIDPNTNTDDKDMNL